MLVLVTYDVSTESGAGRRRLRRVAKVCQNYGQRVQKSVFECVVDPAQWVKLRRDLMTEADGVEDSLRFYFLGSNWERRVEHVDARACSAPLAAARSWWQVQRRRHLAAALCQFPSVLPPRRRLKSATSVKFATPTRVAFARKSRPSLARLRITAAVRFQSRDFLPVIAW